MAKLTPKQQRFVDEYLIDLNATQAAIRAGYSPKTADVQASRLLTNAKVTEAVSKAMKRRETRTEVTQDRVIEELAKIAFSDGSDFAEVVDEQVTDPETGQVTNTQQVHFTETKNLSKEKKAAISQIKYGKNGVEVTSYDKLRALELLGKHLGMFDKHEQEAEETPDDGFKEALQAEAGDVWAED